MKNPDNRGEGQFSPETEKFGDAQKKLPQQWRSWIASVKSLQRRGLLVALNQSPERGAIVPRSASPFAADAFRSVRMDWSAMSEHGRVEAKRGDLALAASSCLDILKSYWIAEPQDVHADIACDQ